MYKSNKTPQEYFHEITKLVSDTVDTYFYQYLDTKNILSLHDSIGLLLWNEQWVIKQQIIFEIYYLIYLLCEEKHSLYHYYSCGTPQTNCVDDTDYAVPLYDYEKFRKHQDDIAKYYYNTEYVRLYNKLSKNNFKDGYKLTLLDYLFLQRCLNNEDIKKLFKVLRDNRLPNSKKINEDDLFTYCFPGIEKLYTSIATTPYSQYSNRMDEFFLRSVDYYQCEKNCAIELSYNAAVAISNSKKSLKEQKNDLSIFRNIRIGSPKIFNISDIIQNKAITLSKKIFSKYVSGDFTAMHISCFYATFNKIVFVCLNQCLHDYFKIDFSRAYWIETYKNPQTVKKELKLQKLDDFMCTETEEFFKEFMGNGQHITPKNWEDIKIKNFRDMYISEE